MSGLRQIDISVKKFYRALGGTSVLVFGFLAVWLSITGEVDAPYFNAAFTVSWIIGCLGIVAVLEYGRRRPAEAEMTWGEAMIGAAVAFFLLFWIYGVVPHLFLTFADSELGWRPDRPLQGPTLPTWWAEGQGLLDWALPFDLNYRVLRDILATGIYGAALAANIAVFSIWQRRSNPVAAPEADRSKFGRPLVRRETL